MKYFIDTEFIEKPSNIQLISIGIVCEDGREYYAVSKDFNIRKAWNSYDLKINKHYPLRPQYIKNYWLRENVLLPIYWELSNEHIPNKTGIVYEEWKKLFRPSKRYFKKLIRKYGKSNKQIAEEIIDFIYGFDYSIGTYTKTAIESRLNRIKPIEFYGYYADYDWVIFCWLFGKMNDLPEGFPMYCKDLKQITDQIGLDENWKNENCPDPKNEHNALADAKWNMNLFFKACIPFMELEVLYHGTKFKYIANKILKEGFKEYTYFTYDLNTAIGQGGKYVFEVVFLKIDLPDYWQVRCINKIKPERIIRMCKYKEIQIIKNKKLQKKIFKNTLEYGEYKPYCFKDSNKLKNILKFP